MSLFSVFPLGLQDNCSGTALKVVGKLYGMAKNAFKPSAEQLRDNLLAYHAAIDPKVRPNNSNALAEKIGVPQRTVYGVLEIESDPYAVLDEIARGARLQPWQLLYPVGDKNMLRLLRAYNEASDAGRRVIEIAVKGVEADTSDNKPQGDTGNTATPE